MDKHVKRLLLYMAWLSLILILTTPTAADLTDGLVGYWPLDGLEASDASGNGLDGTINGLIETAEDRFGNIDGAMLFAGFAGDFVDLGDDDELNILGPMTLAAWVMLDSTNTNNGRVISKMGGGGSRSWSLNIEAGNFDPTFQISTDGNDVISVRDFDELPSDEWAHMVGVYRTGEQTEIYVNGELKEVEDFNIPDEQFSENGLPVLIGSRNACGNCGWVGAIDDVAIWNRDLSALEVSDLFEVGLTEPPRTGDFNDDRLLDAADVNALSIEIAAETHEVAFDLNADALVNHDDLNLWVTSPNIKSTWLGDADLNGEFNSGDFVAVFTTGKYETGELAGWQEGDWDANLRFDSGDFVVAFTDGGYERGPRPPAAAVPEPVSRLLLAAAIISLAFVRAHFP